MITYHASILALKSEVATLEAGYHEIIDGLAELDFRPFEEQIVGKRILLAQMKQITAEIISHRLAIRVLTNLSTPLPAARYDPKPRVSWSALPVSPEL